MTQRHGNNKRSLLAAVASLALTSTCTDAFIPSTSSSSSASAFKLASTSDDQIDAAISISKTSKSEPDPVATPNRRQILRTAFLSAATAGVTLNPGIAMAAGKAGPTPDELNRIKIGYERMNYLLDNFEKETTVCRENGGECKRDADPVRRYMGLRSTTDPLFQIEKVFDKVKYMDLDPDNLETFFEASEEWNTAVNMSNSMAFISQFGEYNPGGGKDEVLKYLEEARKQVNLASGALKKIMTALEIAN